MFYIFDTLLACQGKRHVKLSREFFRDLEWWCRMLNYNNGIPIDLGQGTLNLLIYVDDNTWEAVSEVGLMLGFWEKGFYWWGLQI